MVWILIRTNVLSVLIWVEYICKSYQQTTNIAASKERVKQKLQYCNFGIFRENFILAYSVKTHICNVENSQKGRDLPISVNDRVISPIREDFIFTKLNFVYAKFRENKTLAKIFEFTVIVLISGEIVSCVNI